MRKKRLKQQIFVGVSLLFFCGSTGAGVFRMIQSAQADNVTPAAQPANAQQAEIQAQLKGYELVLQREPENQAALEGLANSRMQLNDVKGAIAPLEKLVKLFPERSDYASQLSSAKETSSH